MDEMHNLLKRQIKKYIGDQMPEIKGCQGLLGAVSGAYEEFDNDRAMLERALELSSQELIRANSQMLKVRDIALGIESRATLNDVLVFVVDSARALPVVRFVMVHQVDDSGKYIVSPYYSKIQDKTITQTLKKIGFDLNKELGKSTTSKKFRLPISKMKVAQDYLANPRLINLDSLSQLLDGVWPSIVSNTIHKILNLKKVVIVPLLIDGKSWGNLLFLLDSHISQDVLGMIGGHCSLGIKNALLIESMQERNQQLAEANTELKQASTNMRIQKELIDRILATTPNAELVIDKKMKIVLANQAFYSNFQVHDVVGKPLFDIMPVNGLSELIIKAQLKKETSILPEFQYSLDGHKRILVANVLPMEQSEVLIVLDDVTEEHEKQERLLLTDRLASVGEMASGVAHELNNPLTSVIGLSSLLMEQATSNSDNAMKEDLIAINTEAQRCAAIVKNMLTFARQHTPKRQPANIAKIVEDVIKLRAYEHKVNNISIETDFPGVLPEVLADYFQIQQVFLNIILNAESAMIEAHGKGNLKITGEVIDNYVRVSFTDDGPGVTKENLQRIFNPFFTTKEVGKGTGLGLSICYGIITSHNGKIYASSEIGQGATFVVELPASDSPVN